jgi:hypothetical protein
MINIREDQYSIHGMDTGPILMKDDSISLNGGSKKKVQKIRIIPVVYRMK